MPDDASTTNTLIIPTQLERSDPFWDIGAGIGLVLVGKYLSDHGVSLWWMLPIALPVAAWVLTGEALTDVPFLGAIASGLRTRLGQRRVHEWALVIAYYFTIRIWPEWTRAWSYTRLGERTANLRSVARRLPRRVPGSTSHCTTTLEVWPTTNSAMGSPRERTGQMDALARVLMNLTYHVEVVASARDFSNRDYEQWPMPPRIQRRWYVVVSAPDASTLSWRTGALRRTLEGIGLRCAVCTDVAVPRITQIERDYVESDGGYCATVVLRRWPREVAPGWLGHALASELPVDVAVHLEPQDVARIARWLKRQQSWQSDGLGLRPDAGDQLGRRDAETVRQKLIARTDRPVKVAVVFTVRAASREQLHHRVATLGYEIGLNPGADCRLARYEQDAGLLTTTPIGICRVRGGWRTLDCQSVASTGIFQPPTVEHVNGASIGTTHDGAMLVKLDPFDRSLESFGGLIVAKVGAGKSVLLKLLARRLHGVEVYIVEQRDPPEYRGVPHATTISLAGLSDEERVAKLRSFIDNMWATAQRDPRPRLLVLDELWSLLHESDLAKMVAELARMGRHYGLSLWIATQQVDDLLRDGKAVLDNAEVRVYLRQHDRDLDALCDAVGLPLAARGFLRSAARGQAVLDVGGLVVPIDIQIGADEYALITTDPRDAWEADNTRERRNGHERPVDLADVLVA